jgi:hypothetical protein
MGGAKPSSSPKYGSPFTSFNLFLLLLLFYMFVLNLEIHLELQMPYQNNR